jgi:O-6-methylguanine DNA methyltransferase
MENEWKFSFRHTIDDFTFEIVLSGSAVSSLKFTDGGEDTPISDIGELGRKVIKELHEYLSGERKMFSVPIKPEGADFQMKVWKELTNIPYGKTRSYSDIAKSLGNPKSARAVGNACNRNPIAIIIPCHRVLGADGALTGYAGGIERKKFLLNLENRN